mmetsp:Transcript_62683/g.149583  ORF Transcript_62683/g.149583 Transcript_62683/m.149583 type:complete len:632 (-) Transcript_62683:45-1940(-)
MIHRYSPDRRGLAERRGASPTSPPVKVLAPRGTLGAPKAVAHRSATPGAPYMTPQVPERELSGLARSGSQSAIISAHVKAPACNSPSTPVRMPRNAAPFASPVRVHGAASPGSPLPQDQRRVLRAVATPLRAEEQCAWSSECAAHLCREGDEALFNGRVRLLDRQIVTNISDAVDSLNRRLVWCPEECCVVFNAAERAYFLLYRHGCKDQAWARFRYDEARGRRAAGRQDSVVPPGSPSQPREVSRQNSWQLPPFEDRSPLKPVKVAAPGRGSVRSPGPASEQPARCGSPVRRAWQACAQPKKVENVRPNKHCEPRANVSVTPKVPPPVSAQCGLSTPREVLERDLTDPEKIEYGDLEFIERLGKGEFGEVFRGYYRREEVAIKQLFFDENMTELVVQDLAREIDSFRHLSHKRLVRFIGACLQLPNLCLVTEYMPGGSLHHLLHVRKQKLPLGHALNMCIQIADGVSYLHSQSPTIVHRDLKSLNVVLDLSLNIKICDFGLTESMDRTHITKKNNGGSPRYMAPELFDCKTKITEKIDVWAMGCIFVEICGGPLPYEKITTLADLTKEMLIKRRTPDIPEFITGHLRDVCSRCLSFHYQDRPSSQRAFELLKAVKKHSKEASPAVSAKAL